MYDPKCGVWVLEFLKWLFYGKRDTAYQDKYCKFFKVWSCIFYHFPNYSTEHVIVKLFNQKTQCQGFTQIEITQDYFQ